MQRLLAFGRPLLMAMLAVVLSFICSLWVSQRDLAGVEGEVRAIASNAQPSILHLDDARSHLEHAGDYAVQYVDALRANAPSSRDQALLARRELDRARNELDRALDAYVKTPFFPGEEKRYREVADALVPVDQSFGVVLDRASAADISAANAELVERLRPGIERVDALFDQLITFDNERAQTSLAAIRGSRRLASTMSLVLGSISFVVSCGATALALTAMQREAARRELLEAERAKRAATEAELRTRDDFLSLAAHTLRTPLTALQLSLQSGCRALSSPSAMLSRAEKQGRRLSGLVEELIEVSQIHLGDVTPARRDVDLAAVVREVVDARAVDAQSARCEVRILGAPSVVGYWDPGQIAHVLSNLLSNAFRFGRGAPIEISIERHETAARVDVRDYGIGIPRARLPFVFDLFGSAVVSRGYGGLGVGLFVARGLVRAHGGSIDVQSTEGGGATFTVDLPLAATPQPGPLDGEETRSATGVESLSKSPA
jgi:signal transduction histidine kinase